MIGSTPATLRKWEATGELLPARKTKGGTRYYAGADLIALEDADAPTICYVRASSHAQKSDIDRPEDRYGAGSDSQRARLTAFRAHREQIEEEARRKYISGQLEPDGSVLIRSIEPITGSNHP